MLHGCPFPHAALLLSDILSPAYTARSLRPPKGQRKMCMPAKMLSHHCLTSGTFLTDAPLLAVLSVTAATNTNPRPPIPTATHCLELMAVSKSLRERRAAAAARLAQHQHQRAASCRDCIHSAAAAPLLLPAEQSPVWMPLQQEQQLLLFAPQRGVAGQVE